MRLYPLGLILVFFLGCSTPETPVVNNKLFQKIPGNESGVSFSNNLKETPQLNIYTWRYIYNGAGVAVGDINNDGLSDLYFCSNTGSNKLYLNKGNLKFEDITKQAKVEAPKGFKTGVTLVDLNADGYLDIYVCRDASPDPKLRSNLLYINNQDNTFTEKGASFGLNDTGYSNQAIFFDYDLDNDLDMYLVNHPNDFSKATTTRLKKDENGNISRFDKSDNDFMRDKFYRNNGDNTFSEVAKEIGIDNHAFGLSASVTDINQDGWPDIFVGNDFIEPDFLYVSNGNGTFSESINQYFKHTSQNTMGNDFADFNNDGFEDMIALDMMPEDNFRQKSLGSSMFKEKYNALLKVGYGHQLMRNTLQLNNGNGTFSEIGEMAGIAKTDWSWSSIFADLDNNGSKDLIITNGIMRDMSNMDYIQFKTDSINKAYKTTGKYPIDGSNFRNWMKHMPSQKIRNYIYSNNDDLTFTDVSEIWGFEDLSFSTGTVVSDLDNDGDLEVIMSNLNEEAFIYKNNSIESSKGNWLKVSLHGNSENYQGIGATIKLYDGDDVQMQVVKNSRGFISSSDHLTHFGLGLSETVDSISVTWPDGNISSVSKIQANQIIEIKIDQAISSTGTKDASILTEVKKLNYLHRENNFDDFNRDPLIPFMQSISGPKMSKGDLNGDDLDDLFVGGAAGFPGAVFFQNSNGSFTKHDNKFLYADKDFEDIGSTIFDANGDGFNDLYVASGGSEFIDPKMLEDRLYLNDGKGNFGKSSIPSTEFSGFEVSNVDIDNDGDQDLFIGGHLIPGNYPSFPDSKILINDGGSFSDATSSWLENPQLGMVSTSLWTDLNGDNKPDLIVAGKWMPIKVFINDGQKLTESTDGFGLRSTSGWWNILYPIDFDQDGDMDLIAGNMGLNSYYKASEASPVEIFTADFDNNGKTENIMTHYINGKRWPVARKELITSVLPGLRKDFFSYEKYANSTIEEIFGTEALSKATNYSVNELRSCLLINNGSSFDIRPLPNEAQVSPIQGIDKIDLENDGIDELLLVGNFYKPEVEQGPYDAGIGVVLKLSRNSAPSAIPAHKTGFIADKDARDLKVIQTKRGPVIVVSNNNDYLQSFQLELN